MSAKPPDRLEPEALAHAIEAELEPLRGAPTAAIRAMRKRHSGRLKHAPATVVLATARRLLQGPTFAHRFVAYELVAEHPAALAALGEAELLEFGRGLDSWWTVDTFACTLSGAVWRAGQVGDAVIEGWARSPDRWWRRAALVSSVPLNLKARGGRGDTARTLWVCGLLVHDRDDMVVKALSWALRELAKRDPAAVRGFLDEHGPHVPARARREVETKLRTGLKNLRKR
jgi:3-methyladenine DNA glycosylase AlkD